MQTIETWLAALGLEKYAKDFRAQEVDVEQLPNLTDADLRELGLPLGPRKRILQAAAQGAIATPAAKPPQHAAERRHVTIMFVDLVGSTALANRLDPEDLRNALRTYHGTCAAAIERWGGMVAKLMGDGVLAYFGWPQAQETSAERAIQAGLEINAAVARLTAAPGLPLAARTGIATGLVVIGDLIGDGAAQEAAVAGETPNLAARLQGAAEPGGLVVCATTSSLAGAMFETSPLPPLALKGFADAVHAVRVLRTRPIETRFAARIGAGRSPILGREQELDILFAAWRRAAAGDGQLVLLTGDAGMGKSHLADAALKSIEGMVDQPLTRIVWQCAPYHSSTAFHPIVANHNLTAVPAASDQDREALKALFDPAAAFRSGLTSGQARHLTLSALGRWVAAQAPAGGAAVLLVEDAHWIDPSTLEVLESNLDAWSRARVFVLVTARPSFPGGFEDHPAVTRLNLCALDRTGVAALAAATLGGKPLTDEALDAIAARADGVPLYVEEIAKALIASGGLTLRDGIWTAAQSLNESGVPPSLAGGLMTRLDRVPAVKETAQQAAVIGRQFSYAGLSSLSALNPPALRGALAQLTEAQIVLEHGDPPQTAYAFRHALLRDAVYDSVLKSQRAILHEKLLAHLKRDSATPLELLAWHAEAAGRRDEASALWNKAGEAAMARPAFREAISHFRRAVTLADPSAALAIETRLGLASIAAHGHSHPDTLAIFEEASRRPDLDRDAASAFVVWYGLWCGHHVRGEAGPARASAASLHAASLAQGAPANVMMGVRSLGITALMNGDARESLARHTQAEAMEDIPRDRGQAQIVGQDQSVSFRSYFGLSLWLAGQGSRGWSLIQESIALARDGGHPSSLGYGLTHAALCALGLGQIQAAAEWSDELFDKASEYRLGMWRDYALRFQGLIRLAQGGDAGQLRQARQALALRGVGLFAAYIDLAAADLFLDRGALDEASEWLNFGRTALQDGNEAWAAPEALRIAGRLAGLRGGQDAAKDLTMKAIARARLGGLKALELKAMVQAIQLSAAEGLVPDIPHLAALLETIDAPAGMPGLAMARRRLAAH